MVKQAIAENLQMPARERSNGILVDGDYVESRGWQRYVQNFVDSVIRPRLDPLEIPRPPRPFKRRRP